MPWYRVLRKYVQNYLRSGRLSSWKRANRRFEDMPGYKPDYKFSICILMDVSGSVSSGDDGLKRFFSEADFMAKKAAVFIIECDAGVSHTFKYRPKMKIEIRGRGGTDFNPAIAKMNEIHKRTPFDVCVYFTDGFCERPTVKSKVPMVWAVLKNGSIDCVPKGARVVRV